jgi:hypothetical protein
MKVEQKETYVQPALVKHELLRDITAQRSGYPGNSAFGLSQGNGPPFNPFGF